MTVVKLKTKVRTIDCTPTWQGVVPLLIAGLESGSPVAREELLRMARLADAYNALQKAETGR